MKQVIIRIRNDKNKLVAKHYYYSQAQFYNSSEDAFIFINNNLLPGMEVQVKVGNQYSTFFLHSDLLDDVNINKLEEDYYDIDMALYDRLNEHGLKYYIKNYLPLY